MDVGRPQFGLCAPEDRGSRLFGYSYLGNPHNSKKSQVCCPRSKNLGGGVCYNYRTRLVHSLFFLMSSYMSA